jgi:hypothetical protein
VEVFVKTAVVSIFILSLIGLTVATAAVSSKSRPFTYDLDALHGWACDTALETAKKRGLTGGCYDVCNSMAVKTTTDGYHYDDSVTPPRKWRQPHPDELYPAFVAFDEYGNETADACAVVLFGGEW